MRTTPHAAAILRAAFTASALGRPLTHREAELAFNTAKEVSEETKDDQDLDRLSHVMTYAKPYMTISLTS